MGKLRVPNSSSSISSRSLSPGSLNAPVPTNGLSGLAKGIASVGSAIHTIDQHRKDKAEELRRLKQQQEDEAKALAERDRAEAESRELATSLVKAKRFMSERKRFYSDNPESDLFEKGSEEFNEFKSQMVSSASSSEVAEALSLKLDEMEIGYRESLFSTDRHQKAVAWGASFDEMFVELSDDVYNTGSIDSLIDSQDILHEYIDAGKNTGRLKDKATEVKLRNKVAGLSFSWAMSAVNTNPELVLKAIDEGYLDGLTASQKESIRGRASTAVHTEEELDTHRINQAFNSDLAQVATTGEGGAWSHEEQVKVSGETVANRMQRQLDNVKKGFSYSQMIIGATSEEMVKHLQQFQPKSDPSSDTFHEESELFKHVSNIFEKAQTAKTTDPYGWFSQNPVVKAMGDELEQDPDNEALQKQMRRTILDLQINDPAILPEQRAVMPKSMAERFVSVFHNGIAVGNEEDPVGLLENIHAFKDFNKGFLNEAITQLGNTSNGESITGKINTLFWHSNNPSMFNLITQAVRKSDAEVMRLFDPDTKAVFQEEVLSSSYFQNYMNAVYSSNSSEAAQKLVNGVFASYKAFSRDQQLINTSVKDSSEAFFRPMIFKESNGTAFFVPTAQTSRTGEPYQIDAQRAANIEVNLRHMLQDQDVNLLNPNTVLFHTEFLKEEEIQSDMKTSLLNNGFWVTSGNGDGVYLYTKGMLNGATSRVKTKEGEDIFVRFEDILHHNFFDRVNPLFLGN